MEQVDAFLEGWNAIGDFREIIFPHWFLLFEIERGMVGGDGLDQPVAQRMPEDALVADIAQRRRHHVFGPLEVRFFGVGFVERQVLD